MIARLGVNLTDWLAMHSQHWRINPARFNLEEHLEEHYGPKIWFVA